MDHTPEEIEEQREKTERADLELAIAQSLALAEAEKQMALSDASFPAQQFPGPVEGETRRSSPQLAAIQTRGPGPALASNASKPVKTW